MTLSVTGSGASRSAAPGSDASLGVIAAGGSGEDTHLRWFGEFTAYDRALGGPDYHLANIVRQGMYLPTREQLWLAGAYGAWYNVPAAEYWFTNWPQHIFRNTPDDEIVHWLRAEHLPYRRERRAIRTPEKTLRYLRTWDALRLPAGPDYEVWWNRLDDVYGLGRYAKMKVLEALHRFGFVKGQPDMRAVGGTSPAEGLALMYPVLAPDLVPLNATGVRDLEFTGALLAEIHGMTFFQTQVYLCEYKQAWAGRQYPGRSLDSEMEYVAKTPLFPTQMWDVRTLLHPSVALGEKRGWDGVRELGQTLPVYGYVWTDLRYDYMNTADLAFPVPWPDS